MKSKAWLTAFAVVALLLIGASGFFAFSASGKFSEARANWGNKVGSINSLERKQPYPNQANVKELSTIVADYKAAVGELFKSLDQFQKQLNMEMLNVEFQEVVLKKVEEFRIVASDANFEISQDNFELGFDAYSNSVPTPAIVPILDYELQAIDHLLRGIVNTGAESMYLFSRDLIPGEVGGPVAQESGVVHKYPVRIGINCSHRAFQEFLNKISNDKEFFYILRVLEVQNEADEGPFKDSGENQQTIAFENKTTGFPASIEMMTEWGYPGEIDQAAAAAAGYVSSGQDARVLMGQEKLRVFMVIDIVRFLDPSEVEANAVSNSSNRRNR